MILDFSVRNFGPFRDRVTLSMCATALKDDPDTVFGCQSTKNGLVTSALIFGANASGKSYFVKALSALKFMLDRPYTDMDVFPSYQPFRLSGETANAPVELRIRLIIGDVLYDYRISYDRNSVVSESLHHYPNGRRARVFVRTGPDSFEYGDKVAISKTNAASAYAAVASTLNDDVCNTFRSEVMRRIVILDGGPESLVQRSCDYISENDVAKRYAMQALRTADMEISDYHSVDREVPVSALGGISASSQGMMPGKVRVREIYLRHDHITDGVDEENAVFPLEIESSGTKAMFGMSGALVDVLLNGGVLVVDEFGSDLHPLITRWIAGQFSNGSNPNHAQLIANTHEISLMDTDELVRRDQIWFVNKDRKYGNSDLYSLSDFKDVRKIKSIDKAYLAGRFDAIPSIRARDVIE